MWDELMEMDRMFAGGRLNQVIQNGEQVEIPVEVVDLIDRCREIINSLKLEQITWTRGGQPLVFDPKDVAEVKFVGLNTC